MGAKFVPIDVGSAQEVRLFCPLTSDTVFGGDWWADEAETVAIVITGVESKILRGDDEVMDLEPFVTTDEGSFDVVIPAADQVANLLPAWDRECRWFFELQSADSEPLAFRGRVVIG